MIIAKEKRNENIIEYLLYMYQIEDIIRASNFDISLINSSIVQKYDQSEDVKLEILQWYEDHINFLKTEGKQDQGHLVYLENIANDLQELHLKLLSISNEKKYKELYIKASPSIQVLQSKTQGHQNYEVSLCLNGLYGYLLLKISKENISRETVDSINDISQMLAFLANKFQKIETGKDELI
ncbi:MAG: DUF4924 domain-containing protein [Bacteroidetes bacterium]|nr:MAG: DUF4924 domain-containing protein [Bacteroidota bacterium]